MKIWFWFSGSFHLLNTSPKSKYKICHFNKAADSKNYEEILHPSQYKTLKQLETLHDTSFVYEDPKNRVEGRKKKKYSCGDTFFRYCEQVRNNIV